MTMEGRKHEQVAGFLVRLRDTAFHVEQEMPGGPGCPDTAEGRTLGSENGEGRLMRACGLGSAPG